ncbi:flagellar hook-basal body complex protein [Rickettsiales bacterium]|nr:flagellar hook-basal body complex protein [Rickettsiales bacterium]
MGLAGARNSAVTGLQSQSSAISISSDNIANASTPGYKAVNGKFSTLVTTSGVSTGYSSGGVSLTAKKLVDEQGLIESTGRVTDIAISGNGFIAVQDSGGSLVMTRAGSFDANNVGELVNAGGFKLMGWPLDNDGLKPGAVGNTNTTAAESTDSLVVVDTDSASGTASATTTIALGMNLNAGQSTLQGATARITFDSTSGANNSNDQDDIIVPLVSSTNGLQEGDKISFTSNTVTSTFEYGGFARSRDVTKGIFGATAATTTFSTGTLTDGSSLADGDKFTITAASAGTSAVTFTFTQTSPDTSNGQFNSLTTLATAINSTTGLTARVYNNVLFVSSTDANESITFGDVSSSNLHKELGFSNVLSGSDRFNSLKGLETLVDAKADLEATVNSPTAASTLDIFSSDPLLTLAVIKNQREMTVNLVSAENGNNGQSDLIVPVKGTTTMVPSTAAGNGTASSSQLVIVDDQSGGATTLVTYGGIETGDEISTTNTMFGAATPTTAFTTGVTNGHTMTINDGTTTRTYSYTTGTPVTTPGSATFNSLQTLADAINADTAYFRARVENNRLYVASVDADLGLTFANGGATDFTTNFGLSNVTASGTGRRFATLLELRTIIDGTAEFAQTTDIVNTGNNSTFTIKGATAGTAPLYSTAQVLAIDSTSAIDLVAELGLSTGSGSDNNVGDGMFKEFGLDGVVSATAISATVAATYSATDSSVNMASGNVTPAFSRNVRVFDSLGTGHDFRFGFIKLGTNKWGVEFYAINQSEVNNGRTGDGLVASGTLEFNGDGSLKSKSGDFLSTSTTITWTTGATANTVSFSLGTAGQPAGTSGATVIGLTDGVRQFDAAYNVEFVEQNGVAAGQFDGIEIAEDGTINAKFTNGQVKAIYKLPILTVPNTNGLTAKTGNIFAASQASGEINVKDSGSGGAGKFVAGALEGSTADIAEELTKTIGIQSTYNANASLISTIRSMEEELNRRL